MQQMTAAPLGILNPLSAAAAAAAAGGGSAAAAVSPTSPYAAAAAAAAGASFPPAVAYAPVSHTARPPDATRQSCLLNTMLCSTVLTWTLTEY